MKSDQDQTLREQLLRAMRGDEAHIEFESVMKGFPFELAGVKPNGVPHSAWQLLEHLRIAQHDILEFSRNPAHKSPKWPEGYWPEASAPRDKHAWEASAAAFIDSAKELAKLVDDHSLDLFAQIEGGDGQTLLREALVITAHNSYHIGQLEFLKKMLLAKG